MERRAVTVRGIVQGVGFRPFVHRLAAQLRLNGFVQNAAGCVRIEVEGESAALEQFLDALQRHPPPLARIDDISWSARSASGATQFRIAASDAEASGPACIAPDSATCDDCLAELFDPQNRRYRYPFLNCTQCGPRLTIVCGAPYDRARTTMAGFPLCDACRAEFTDPQDRRFHAQPIACPRCGPRLACRDYAGALGDGADPLAQFVGVLLRGGVGALKGLGGYHLVCDARSETAVAELRRRKRRDAKPFAVMVRDLAAAAALCEIDDRERQLLASPQRPIVLLRRRRDADDRPQLASGVAPGNPYLGVMLPYSPLHHLLLHDVDGAPLVMTSGNVSTEPIAHEDEDALRRLQGIADVFLTHDRPIHVRCEDSVTRVVAGTELPVRRSRGAAPLPIELPWSCPHPLLAVGGQLKGTFALGRARQAILSHHLGDLDHYDAYRAFVRDVALYEELFALRPEVLVHDLHPDYLSTRFAQERAQREGLPTLAVQHHHAHLASCLAETGLTETVIGVCFDGAGLGTDAAIWGGEFLVGDATQFRRAAHLRYVRQPGGEQAVREPWRMAWSHLLDAGCEPVGAVASAPSASVRTVARLLERGLNSPWTSSAGRLFDAVAVLAGVGPGVDYEGQAAAQLEWLAEDVAEAGSYPYTVQSGAVVVVDTRPLLRGVAEDVRKGRGGGVIARRFHATLTEIIADVCGRLRAETGLDAVVLSGGVFQNALLTRLVGARLDADGFRVHRQRRAPPNDGGLSLGQLAVAAATLAKRP